MFTGTRMRDLTLHTVCADIHDEDYSSDECYSSSSISLLFFCITSVFLFLLRFVIVALHCKKKRC